MSFRLAPALLLVALIAAACSGSDDGEIVIDQEQLDIIRQIESNGATLDDIELPPQSDLTVAPPETRPLDDPPTAVELDIALDPSGRPYDVEQGWYDGTTLEAVSMGGLHIADGDLRIMDGNLLEVDPVDLLDGESVSVAFDTDRLDLTMLFARYPSTDEQAARRSTVAVRIDVPGAAPVAEWQPYEAAYGTDGGVGGVTSGAIVDGAADQIPYADGGDLFVSWDYSAEYYLGAHASTEGPDVFIYGNGFGDGGFPMSKGIDADGRLVSLVLPTLTYPWRLMVPDGTPPADVTEREDQFIECLNGERPVTVDDRCLTDDEL